MTGSNSSTPFSGGFLERLSRRPYSVFGCSSVLDFLLACLFVGGFVAILLFFGLVDVYDNHYGQASYSGLYNAFRVVFTAYYFWLLYAVGRWASIRVLGRGPIDSLPLHERLAFGFFVGVAVTTVVMLALGFLYLYWRIVMAVIAVPLVAASYRTFRLTCAEAAAAVGQRLRRASWPERILWSALSVAAVLAAGLLLLVKGLYPQGGHDYYVHYFHFYSEVVEKHNIWPNQFWYHYYLSKGLGVMFLAMLLTDNLAPSLVSFCCAVAAALLLFSLVRGFTSRTLWPWVAAILYLALNVNTIGWEIYASHGGWGHFQKPHEVNSPLLIAIVCMAANMVRSEGLARRHWWFGAAVCAFAIGNILLLSPVIVGLFAVIAMFAFMPFRRDIAWAFFGIAFAAGLGLFALLLLNYVTTGAPADIASNIWWPIIDLRRVNEWGMLYDLGVNAYKRSEMSALPGLGGVAPVEDFLVSLLRLDILHALLVYSAACGVACLIGWSVLRRLSPQWTAPIGPQNLSVIAVILSFAATMAVFTPLFGLAESVSYVRITSFMMPFMIAVAAIVWQVGIVAIRWPLPAYALLARIAPLALICVPLMDLYEAQRSNLVMVVGNAVRFADGRFSIYDSYKDQRGWPALPNASAIYPPIYEAWKTIGPGKRIWSFHVHSYCVLPGCRVESQYSAFLSKNRDRIMYGSPEEAREILQREGLNYFFVSTVLGFAEHLACAPLFSVDTLSKYFDVQWTDGTDALLTWRGQGTAPIPAGWLEKYREMVAPSKWPCTPPPFFQALGHLLTEEVSKGKRWGAEVPLR